MPETAQCLNEAQVGTCQIGPPSRSGLTQTVSYSGPIWMGPIWDHFHLPACVLPPHGLSRSQCLLYLSSPRTLVKNKKPSVPSGPVLSGRPSVPCAVTLLSVRPVRSVLSLRPVRPSRPVRSVRATTIFFSAHVLDNSTTRSSSFLPSTTPT